MNITSELRSMGWSNEQIASATVDGKPMAEVDKKKPSKFDGMNKTESRYAAELDWLKREGKVIDYWFEKINLKLAYKTHYRPDFLVQYADGRLVFVEIKGGYVRDDSAVKFKTAREMFPMFQWICLQKTKEGWRELFV